MTNLRTNRVSGDRTSDRTFDAEMEKMRKENFEKRRLSRLIQTKQSE